MAAQRRRVTSLAPKSGLCLGGMHRFKWTRATQDYHVTIALCLSGYTRAGD